MNVMAGTHQDRQAGLESSLSRVRLLLTRIDFLEGFEVALAGQIIHEPKLVGDGLARDRQFLLCLLCSVTQDFVLLCKVCLVLLCAAFACCTDYTWSVHLCHALVHLAGE